MIKAPEHTEENASDPDSNKHLLIQDNSKTRSAENFVKKSENEKQKSKPFPSTLNIRPIVPVQSPQITGSSLKPIQPKPTILPAPTINLSLDSLKKSPKQMEKSPKNIAAELFPKGNP